MTCLLKRGKGRRIEYLGKDSRGDWQWTADKSSATKFQTRHTAFAAWQALVAQTVGVCEIEEQ